jgi:uncharacterized radical SAM superfamily Fe-S cluster-containing enzyme
MGVESNGEGSEAIPGLLQRPAVALRDELLKRTQSRCPVCHRACPGEVWRTAGVPSKVMLKRACPEHGEFSACIASDARFYWLSRGRSACRALDAEPAGTLGRNARAEDALGVMEQLSTCLALIEIVHSCNLACPTCYADSPAGAGSAVQAVPLEDLKRRIQGVVDRKGEIDILQLSGGEPTLHPRFFELLEWAQEHPGIRYVLLNTNGVRIARDEAFARQLERTFRRGRFQLYLQFDGPQAAGQTALRGADLRGLRERCARRCAEMRLPVTLAMTVTTENLPHVWEATEHGLQWPNVRGIAFQPFFASGRVPESARPGGNPARRLNTADLILALVEQSKGQLRFEDFTPLPCGDPNCATIGYLLKVGGQARSISEFIDFKSVQGFLADRARYSLEDLRRCGCESQPLGHILKRFELDETHTFRLLIKPFMDAHSWDEDRIDRCCTHVIRPDGKLDSFCRHYSGFPQDAAPERPPIAGGARSFRP